MRSSVGVCGKEMTSLSRLDIGLEFEESERYQNFKDFYFDVRPEFERFGRVVVFKVCCNAEKHLRGNVYVQYETSDISLH